MIVSIVQYYFSYKALTTEASTSSLTTLHQISNASKNIYNDIYSISAQLLNDNKAIDFLYGNNIDYINQYRLKLKIDNIRSGLPNMHSFSTYNGRLDHEFVPNKMDNTNVIKWIKNTKNKNYITMFLRNLTNATGKVNLLTFVISPSFGDALPYDSAIIINIYEDSVRQYLLTSARANDENLFIVNDNGQVISHTSPDLFNNNLNNIEYVNQILVNNEASGYSIIKIDGQDFLLSFVKEKTFNWNYISLLPLNKVVNSSKFLLTVSSYVSISVLLIGVLFFLFSTKHLYKPIKTLMSNVGIQDNNNGISEFDELLLAFKENINNISTLKNSANKSIPLLKIGFYHNLLEGTIEKPKDVLNIINEFEENLTGPYYSIALIKIDKDKSISESLKITLIDRIIIKNTGALYKSDFLYFTGEFLVLLLQINTRKIPENLMISLSQTQTIIQKEINTNTAIALSESVDSISLIKNAYSMAKINMEYCYYYGNNALIFPFMVEEHIKHSIKYPYNIEQKIIELIKKSDTKNMDDQVNSFGQIVGQGSINETLVCFNQISLSVQKYYNKYIEPGVMPIQKQHRVITPMNINDSIKFIKFQFKGIIEYLDQIKNIKNKKIMSDMKEHVDDNYTDPDFSLEHIANHLNMSTGHVSRIFMQHGDGFSHYLCEVRLQLACFLLENTHTSIDKISQNIGIRTPNYFYALFKKHYGTTPSKFRNNSKK